MAEGETKAALIANLHEFQSDFSASFRFAQDANLFAGRIVDDSMDLSYSLASIAGLRSLPLFTSNELHSYALLSEYQQQIIEFEKANKRCFLILLLPKKQLCVQILTSCAVWFRTRIPQHFGKWAVI